MRSVDLSVRCNRDPGEQRNRKERTVFTISPLLWKYKETFAIEPRGDPQRNKVGDDDTAAIRKPLDRVGGPVVTQQIRGLARGRMIGEQGSKEIAS
jgi:hypothetical protein